GYAAYAYISDTTNGWKGWYNIGTTTIS
ncbi:hypothetical protein C8D87_1021, partial [Lentzea atacamensis]